MMRAPCGEPGRTEKVLEERPCLFKPRAGGCCPSSGRKTVTGFALGHPTGRYWASRSRSQEGRLELRTGKALPADSGEGLPCSLMGPGQGPLSLRVGATQAGERMRPVASKSILNWSFWGPVP